MELHRIYDADLAQSAYLVGCGASGEALVVDPERDIDRVIEAANARGLTIVGVAETHIHADFVSGARDLAREVDATLLLSAETDEGWEYSGLQDLEDVRRLNHGDSVAIGDLEITALHTPGHTPEHLAYLVHDAEGEPQVLLSGDFLFVGDLGRPDLLETAAGAQAEISEDLAGRLFECLRSVVAELPQDVLVWPGHGAGSACGKSMGSNPVTSIGYERRNAWWAESVAEGRRDDFVDQMLSNQPETPHYFRRMKIVNRDGAAPHGRTVRPNLLYPRLFRALRREGAQLLDLRDHRTFARGHVAGSINLAALGALSQHAGWVVSADAPVVLIGSREQVDEATRKLLRIGIEDIRGAVEEIDHLQEPTDSFELVSAGEARDLIDRGAVTVLDVRSRSEWNGGHLPNARHIHFGALSDRVDELPGDNPVLVYCGSGIRSSIACGILERNDLDVINLDGGFRAWSGRDFEIIS